MTVTLLAAADEPPPQPDDTPQPAPRQPDPTPTPSRPRPTWWHHSQHRRGTNPIPAQRTEPGLVTVPLKPCCDALSRDRCTCANDLAKVRRAFAPAGSGRRTRGPIFLDLTRSTR